jgi:hypothetical protein
MQTYIKTTDFAPVKSKPGYGRVMPGNIITGPSSLTAETGKDDMPTNNQTMTAVQHSAETYFAL